MVYLPLVILAMAHGSDRDFMTELYLTHRVLMYAMAYKVLGNEPDARDAVSEACERLIVKIDVLRTLECCTLRSYVVSTVRHTAINCAIRRDRRSRYAFSTEDEAAFVAAEEEPEQALVREAELAALEIALAQLPDNQRAILQMKYLNELSDAEIAKTFGIKPSSVRQYLRRARENARELLKEMI